MVLAEDLRQAVLQAAIQGKLTERNSADTSIQNTLSEISDKRKYLNIDRKLLTSKEIDLEEVPFELPKTWKWIRLGSICEVITKGSSPKWQGINYTENGLLFVTSENVGVEKLLLSERKYVDEKFDEISPRSSLKYGDLLTNIVGASIGRTALYDLEEKANINQAVCIIRLINLELAPYVMKYMNSNTAYKIMMEDKVETARPNISLTNISDFLIPLPPIEEQQRIVDKINEIMLKVDEYEEIEKKLEAIKKEFPTDMKDSLLQAAMQGKLTEQLESDSSVDELVKKENINPLDEEDYPYVIPVNWTFAELGELTSIPIKRGKAPKYVEKSGILVFAQKCNQKIGKISLADAKYLDENVKHKYEQDNYLQGDDIVINSTGGGTLGRIGYISEALIKQSLPIVPDSHITTIRTKDKISSKYIYFFLKFHQSYLETMGVGSTNQTELRPDTIKELLVPLPPLEEQCRIVERLDALLPLCEDLKE